MRRKGKERKLKKVRKENVGNGRKGMERIRKETRRKEMINKGKESK